MSSGAIASVWPRPVDRAGGSAPRANHTEHAAYDRLRAHERRSGAIAGRPCPGLDTVAVVGPLGLRELLTLLIQGLRATASATEGENRMRQFRNQRNHATRIGV